MAISEEIITLMDRVDSILLRFAGKSMTGQRDPMFREPTDNPPFFDRSDLSTTLNEETPRRFRDQA